MTNRGRGNSNRGRSRGRPYTKGSLRAGSNASQTFSPDLRTQSPARDSTLPAVDNNSECLQHTGLSSSPSPFTFMSPTSLKDSSTSERNSSNASEAEQPSDPTSLNDTAAGGDNEPPPGKGSIQLGGGKDNSISAPSIELVLAELRVIKEQVSEIKDIKQQISKLDTIESTTGALSDKLTGVMNRTSELETAVHSNSARLREYDDQLSSISATVGKQDKTFSSIKAIKEDFSKTKEKAVADINKLISVQREQVDSLPKNILAEVDKRLAKAKRQADFQSLKDQAFNSRNNLVLVGLAEASDEDTSKVVSDFFSKSMGIKNIKLGVAYRMGSPSTDSPGTYSRPILVHFPILPQRNKVWRKRSAISGDNNDQKVRIHADLPKQLRDDVQALYMVAKAASSSDKYQMARVRNYTLEIDNQVFLPSELEMLPPDIRPSSLAAPRSDAAIAFFSRHAVFSNHHPSFFTIGDHQFQSMEQFLALRRAQLSGNASLIQRASEATDPVQAKYILSALRQDNTQLWDEQVEATVMEGLEAKFRQNPAMKSYLCHTGDLSIGEASTSPRWGVGMSLEDKDILDVSKWNKSGNLLGRSLMKLRTIFFNEAQNHPA